MTADRKSNNKKLYWSMEKSAWIIHINIVIYALCFWLVQPLMPFLLKQFGASTLSFGYFQSLFNIAQLGGGLVVGFLQDSHSGTTALNITQLGSFAVYACLIGANSLTALYLSRLLTVLQQSMQVAQAYISKTSQGQSRTKALSRLSFSYCIGMIVGSSSSGFLADNVHHVVPIGLAATLSCSICIVNSLFLDNVILSKERNDDDDDDDDGTAKHQGRGEDNSTPRRRSQQKESNSQKESKMKEIRSEDGAVGSVQYLSIFWNLRKLMLFLTFIFATRSMNDPVFNMMLVEVYGVSKSQMGSLVSTFALIGVTCNVLLVPLSLHFVSETVLTRFILALGCIAYACLSISTDVLPFLALLFILAGAGSMLYTLSTSYISKQTSPLVHGQAIALTHALRSAVGIVFPLVGTMLYSQWGGGAVAWLNAVLLVLGLSLV